MLVAVLIGVALVLVIGYFALNATRPLPVAAGGPAAWAERSATWRTALREGAVIDFIDPVAWPAFNLADVAIVVGVAVLLYLVEGSRDEDRAASD